MSTQPNLLFPQPDPSEYIPSSPEDEERERQIWEKINRGPRERAKELTAEGWKERYGITPESGKLAKIFAALGETGRSITQKDKYVGIADQAADRGLKEYQAEVGPLQRELGVLSQARTAGARIQQKATTDAMNAKFRAAEIMIKDNVAAAKVAQTLGLTPQEIEKVEKSMVERGLIVAKTASEIAGGGMVGEGRNALIQSGMSPEQQASINRIIFQNRQSRSMGDLMGNPRTFETTVPGAPRTSTTMRDVPAGVGPGGFQLFEQRPSTTTSMGAPRKVIDNDKLNNAVSQFQQQMGIVGQQAAQEEPIILQPPGRESIQFQRKNTPEKTELTIENGRTVARPKLDPILREALSPFFPSVDWNRSDAVPTNFRNLSRVAPPKKELTPQEEIAQSSIDTGKRLARNGVQQYISGDLGGVAGILGGAKGAISRMFGKSTTGQTMINAEAKRLFAEYSLAMTGKSSNPTEKQRYESIMPTTGDNEITFMQKALTGVILASQTDWLNGLNLKGPARDELMKNPTILDAPKLITERAFQHMEGAKAAKKVGGSKYRIDDREYEVSEVDDRVWNLLTNTNKLMQDAFWEVYPNGNGVGPPKSAAKIK